MRLSGRAFLGQVALRDSRVRALGQNAPVTVIRRLPESNPEIPFQPFNPTLTREELDRREAALPQYAKQKAECDAADENILNAKAAYDLTEGQPAEVEDAAYQEYSKAVDAYNACREKLDAITHYMDFGGQVPYPVEWEWPKEIPEPESYQYPPTPTQPQPQPPPVQAPPVASTDWRFEGCPPGTQRIVRGGACVPPGLLSTALNVPSTTTTPMSTSSSYLRGRIPAEPLYRGRF